MKTREIHLNEYLKGEPKPENYSVAETELAQPGEGEVQVKNLYISVDPYMRGRMSGIKTYIEPFQIGAVMEGGAVGEVTASNFEGLKPGELRAWSVPTFVPELMPSSAVESSTVAIASLSSASPETLSVDDQKEVLDLVQNLANTSAGLGTISATATIRAS